MKRNTPPFFWSSLSERLRTIWRMGHSSIIPPEYPRMLRDRERCSITGRGRDVIDVSSDDNVTTPGLVWNGMGHTLESKLQDKNNLVQTYARTHTHTHTHARKQARSKFSAKLSGDIWRNMSDFTSQLDCDTRWPCAVQGLGRVRIICC